jgi:hypothetical protein
MRGKTAVVLLLLMGQFADAAPFCAVYSYGRKCYYYSMETR